MPGGYKNIKPEDGKQFTPENQPENRGRKPSIKKQIAELFEKEGKITIPKNQVAKINEDGSVAIILPTQMQVAMKLISLVMGKDGNVSMRGIQMLIEHFDGKPTQTVEQKTTHEFKGDPFEKIRDNAGINNKEKNEEG